MIRRLDVLSETYVKSYVQSPTRPHPFPISIYQNHGIPLHPTPPKSPKVSTSHHTPIGSHRAPTNQSHLLQEPQAANWPEGPTVNKTESCMAHQAHPNKSILYRNYHDIRDVYLPSTELCALHKKVKRGHGFPDLPHG